MSNLKVIYHSGDTYRSVGYYIPEFSQNSELVEVRQWKEDISDPDSPCGPPRISWSSIGRQPVEITASFCWALQAAISVAKGWEAQTGKVFDWGEPKTADLTEKEDEPS